MVSKQRPLVTVAWCLTGARVQGGGGGVVVVVVMLEVFQAHKH